jgi:DNA-binding transcriptional ArsR family regulator
MDIYQVRAQQLKALGHPVRLALVDVLRSGECHVSDLQRQLHRRQPCISQHLRVLNDAGLVSRSREGTYIYYRLTNPTMIEQICSALGLNCRSETHDVPINVSMQAAMIEG